MSKLYKNGDKYTLKDFKLNEVNEMYLDCDPSNFLNVDVRVLDQRHISEQQRKFIFALCNEISYYTGEDSEYIRLLLQQYNANLRGVEVESLSSCDMTYANGLIDTIIDYCIENEIPIGGNVIKENKYQFTEHQVYMMCLKRVCVVCGAKADIHHVDSIGMGNNRQKVSHVGKRALPLCRMHHQECHNTGNEKFINMYHLEPITIDKKLEYFIKKGKIREFKD